MKLIVLAKLSRRVLGKLFDFLLVVTLSSLVFFLGVYPATFDKDAYLANENKIALVYEDSGLYVKAKSGGLIPKSSFTSINEVRELIDATVKLEGETIEHLNLTESLVDFYTSKITTYGYQNNLSFDVFKKEVLKLGSKESNIKDLLYDDGKYEFILIDSNEGYQTVLFVINAYQNATTIIQNSKEVKTLTDENIKLMSSSLILFIPIFVGFSFIFDLIIPLFSKNGESIGKRITKTCLLTKDGYQVKKWQIVVRWLTYLIYDVALSVMTFFGAILISYTMLMFNKKKRTVEDYVAGTVVVDKQNSIWFKSKEDEERYKERSARFSV